MKTLIPFLLSFFVLITVGSAQQITPTELRSDNLRAEEASPTIASKSPQPTASYTVAMSYYDPNLSRLQWQFPKVYGSFLNLYLMQRFTLPNNAGYLDSISVWIEDVNEGSVRFRILPDTAIDFGTATFRMPNFSVLYDEKTVDKSLLKMRGWNMIKLSGALVPKDFFVTVEYTIGATTNNIVTILSDARIANNRSEQDSRVVMINQVGTDIQATLMDSLFTISGGARAFPYLLMTAFADTSTFSAEPQITTTPNLKAYTNVEYAYDVHASGKPRPVYSLLLAPPSLTLNSFSGEARWKPAIGDIGNHTISIRAQNTNGSQDQTYTLQVLQSVAPKITSTPKKLGIVNELYTYQLSGTGAPPPTFALSTAPAGMTINSSGLIQWNPGATQAGNFNVAAYAKNGVANDTQRYVLHIDVNAIAPTFTSIAKTTGVVGQAYSYQSTVSGNPQPIFSLIKNPTGMLIDQTSGLVSWSNPTEGSHEVTIRAENRVGSKEQSYTLVISAAPAIPNISSTPITEAIAEELYNYRVIATGNPSPTYSVPTAPAGMQISASTGMISWTPLRTQKGNNNVVARATNSAGNAEQPFTINVKTKPKITSTPILNAEETKLYQYQVVVDASPDAVCALTQSPTGMTINPTTGAIAWTPTNAQIGSHSVTVTATNSVGTDQQQFTIIVKQTVGVEADDIPQNFSLGRAYPNPASMNGIVSIDYSLATSSTIRIELRNLLGQVVEVLLDEQRDAGIHSERFRLNAFRTQLTEGMYSLIITNGTISRMRLLVIMK